jgi:hypothetical protein
MSITTDEFAAIVVVLNRSTPSSTRVNVADDAALFVTTMLVMIAVVSAGTV